MKIRRSLYFVLIVASVGLACGLDLSVSDLPFMPTGTPTLLPTRTPTVTPTYPPKLEAKTEQFSIEVQEDTSTLFTDNTLGYQLQFNPEWLVLPVEETLQGEYFAASADELPPNMRQLVADTSRQAGMRMIALDYIFAYSPQESNIGYITVVYKADLASVEYSLDILLDADVATIPTLVPDAKVTYQSLQTNSNGFEYGKMVISHPASTTGTPIRQMLMMVKLDEGLLVITGSVEEDMYFSVESVFQKIFDSFNRTN